MTLKELNEDNKFEYMMLSRLKQDNDYFLGNKHGSEKQLWAGNIEDQIKEMHKLWKQLKDKPEWISLKDIEDYEKKMLKQRG